MKSDSDQTASTARDEDGAGAGHRQPLHALSQARQRNRPKWLAHTLEAFGQDVLLLALERMALPQRELSAMTAPVVRRFSVARASADTQADSAVLAGGEAAGLVEGVIDRQGQFGNCHAGLHRLDHYREANCPLAVPMLSERGSALRLLADDQAGRDDGQCAPVQHGCQQRMLVTILFTDIVGSTLKAQALGDKKWSSLLERHRTIVRRQLALLEGREIEVPGDGFLAIFDTATSAAKCARAIRAALRRVGLEIRAGLHAGECEVAEGRLIGIAVHIAARVVRIAEAGQILVSSTVRDLALGSGLSFSAGETHALKGLADSWQLFELTDVESKARRSFHSKGQATFGLHQKLS